MIYMWSTLIIISVGAILYVVIRNKKKRSIHFSLYVYARSKSLKENINNIKKISRAHKPASTDHSPLWTYRLITKKWKSFRRDYNMLYSLQGKYDELVPSSKWITDNYYLINRNIKQVVKNFNNKNCRNLPAITIESSDYFPRIYVLVKELMTMMDFNFSEQVMLTLTEAYQKINPLKISELWALPIMIKICLLEDIASIVEGIKDIINNKIKADIFINELTKSYPKEDLLNEINRSMAGKTCAEPLSFSSQVLLRMKERGISSVIDLEKLVASLPCVESSYTSIINHESVQQASIETKISNLIISLGKLNEVNWEDTVCRLSVVDNVLSCEENNIFKKMTFKTKETYRYEIETLAKKAGKLEKEIAERILEFTKNKSGKQAHVGYYLIDRGKAELLDSYHLKISLLERISNKIRNIRDKLYFLILFTVIFLFSLSGFLYTFLTRDPPSIILGILTFFILIIPGFSILTDIVNQVHLNLVTVKNPPAMDFEDSIPMEFSTVIIVPVILGSISTIDRYIAKLEQLYHLGCDPNLFYAILVDFKDSPVKIAPEDEILAEYAKAGMEELNDKIFSGGQGRFMMFCRYRRWNESQQAWMGWERKRGKLEEFNEYVLGGEETTFYSLYGNINTIAGIKYVITVDSDTDLIRDSANRLVGIMAHPLNKPIIDEAVNKVVEGFGLMQPRVTVHPDMLTSSVFSRLFAANSGFDPYTTFVSDIYQDVFYEGVFIGKGIYDLEVFNTILRKKIPENTVLSHDLLEGSMVRCGYASGIQVFDGIPPDILSFFKRQHRWVRGDWQLMPWLFGRDKLKFLTRWQMLSNLIRSLEPVSLIIFLSVVIFWFQWPAILWLGILLFPIAIPFISQMNSLIFYESVNISLYYALKEYTKSVLGSVLRGLLFFIILPYRTFVSVDAIIRTLYRMYISKSKMLEWQTQYAVEKSMKTNISSYLKRMLPSIAAGILFISAAYFIGSIPTFIIGGLWLLSPLISYLSGLEIKRKRISFSQVDRHELYSIARAEYRFFEETMLPEYNNLIPDNFQTVVREVYAPRTSPTNIGLQLMAFLSARDMGFISLNEFHDRLDKTIETISKMKKWHGHLYNWYDISTLEPLLPNYISSVDSGNFIGFLICLKNGLKDILDKPVFSDTQVNGIKQTMLTAGFEEYDFNPTSDTIRNNLDELIINLENSRSPWVKPDFKDFAIKNILGFINDYQDFQPFGGSINEQADAGNMAAVNFRESVMEIAREADKLIKNTDFTMLYDRSKHMFHIGFNTYLNRYDDSYYDFIASESRLTGYLAISKGDIPQKHWYHLSRPLTLVKGCPTLLSWGGTMFEYFMPHILMRVLPNTVFEKTLRRVLKVQIRFAAEHNIPWGISESAYYRFDQNLNYQYRAFGVPSLGVRSDLSKFLVVSPYSSFLAASGNPKAFLKNLKSLKDYGVFGKYGFFEAIDFMAAAGKEYKKPNIIKTYMCHHKGMSLAALNNLLNNNILQDRFHSEPIIKSSEILLEERKQLGIVVKDEPRKAYVKPHGTDDLSMPVARVISNKKYKSPIMHVISNDRFQSIMSSTGSGYMKFKDKMINPWSNDSCNDTYGCFIYIKDIISGRYFSITYSPTFTEPDFYEVVFSADKAEYKRVENNIDCRMEITVSPQSNAEIRRITLTNLRPEQTAELEVVSFIELSLDSKRVFDAHPAFQKLFVETEFDRTSRSVIAVKRPRTLNEETIYFGATCLVDANPSQMFEYETERDRFIGRGRSLRNPISLENTFNVLRGTGEVVDPCISLKNKVRIPSYQSVSISFINAAATSKTELIETLKELKNPYTVMDVFKNALFDSKVEMQYFNLNYEKTNKILDLLTIIMFPNNHHGLSAPFFTGNVLDQRDLWKFGISGDNPIILMKVKESGDLDAVKDVVTAYEYLSRNQVDVDLVIMNEKDEGYLSDLSNAILDITSNVKIFETGGVSAGVFLLKKNELTPEECKLMDIVAQVILTGEDRILGDRISDSVYENVVSVIPDTSKDDSAGISGELPHIDLDAFNGLGGFTKDGTEYVIELKGWRMTPAPWVNIISNKNFGCICTEAGPGYTYCLNSRENKLTEWTNDPLINKLPEIVYIKDMDTLDVFCPTLQPLRAKGSYRIIHGFGYTKYIRNSNDFKQDMTVFVHKSAKLKYTVISLENTSDIKRNISVYYYADLVLGFNRDKEASHLFTGYDGDEGIITAENVYTTQYKGYKAYLYSELPVESFTCDKNEFFRFNSRGGIPFGIRGGTLDGKCGNGLNPCAVVQCSISFNPGEKKQFVFILGQEKNIEKINKAIDRYGSLDEAQKELELVKHHWNNIVGKLKVTTPDMKINYMLNGWLLYQSLACRLYARSSFYQSGGAYGFRDQLQDSLAFVYTNPDITRKMIVTAAKRQFVEGDVQHWWHADSGAGVRTTISDDLLWLPYALSEYIRATGDSSVLDETTAYLEMPLLEPGEHEKFGLPVTSKLADTVYEHSKKTIKRSIRFGSHGLPLIGSGDWNDGMNMVGVKGTGESVWLAFFLYDVMIRFREIAEQRDDIDFIRLLNEKLTELKESIEKNCWDGQWFLRAFFDDGSTLGSKNNMECKIDAISQSWAVISGAASTDRAALAMDELIKYLVDDNEKMILLLYPPFYRSRPNPGYIQGYLRGIRENGGQYTHGAIWAVEAAALLRLNDEAYMLYDYINPITHTMNEALINKYRLEPYIMSADIYYNKMQKGRGGWSWYTGSASWMYRVGIYNILGFRKLGDRLYIEPSIPSSWYKYDMVYKYGKSVYNITVEKKISDTLVGKIIIVDDDKIDTAYIPLLDDHNNHQVSVII